ncbi:MAG TPA: rod shape-determining protein MreD [Paenalcaligenes sp.]|nr:rod shape-determining protein MreD [Paenalcaligenes sp.]
MSKKGSASRIKSSIGALQPLDTSPFRHPSSPWLIGGSIFLVWLVSLLPWRIWVQAPDLLMLVLCFWALHEPRRVNMLLGFFLGILIDVHDGSLLGEHALGYVLAIYGVHVLRRRLLLFNAGVQAIHLLPVFLVALAVPRFAHAWLVGEWMGWGWGLSAVFIALLWPLVDFLLFLPQRRLDASDEEGG